MAVNTILLDFTLDPNLIETQSQQNVIATNIENILRDYLTNLKSLHSVILDDGCLMKIYSSDYGATIKLQFYGNGLTTINIDYFKGENEKAWLQFEKCRKIVQDVTESVGKFKKSTAFVPIQRGLYYKYFPTSDDRLMEYDIDELVFEERSPYQKVQIVHSKTLGNMLILDDLQNISEADLVYTETLMARGKENYKGKDVLILGGGDGALLYELLKEKPNEVIMLELDEVVMTACAKYMRSICGDVLDNMTGPHYKIIVGDCMKTLDQYIKEGRKFDYIFGDLTDVPISDCLSGPLWTFCVKVLQTSFKVLKPDGKFMTHLIGTSSPQSIETYQAQLRKLQPPVKFTMSNAYVPSFLENWVFCQVGFDHNQSQ